jgi:hypothetical protein
LSFAERKATNGEFSDSSEKPCRLRFVDRDQADVVDARIGPGVEHHYHGAVHGLAVGPDQHPIVAGGTPIEACTACIDVTMKKISKKNTISTMAVMSIKSSSW